MNGRKERSCLLITAPSLFKVKTPRVPGIKGSVRPRGTNSAGARSNPTLDDELQALIR